MSRHTRFQTLSIAVIGVLGLIASARRQRHTLVAFARTIPNATAWSIRCAALLLALWVLPATAHGQIFVTNNYTVGDPNRDHSGSISEYNATTGATINAALVSGLNYPGNIAVSGGNLFVTNVGTYTNSVYNPGSGSIGKYTTSGATVNAALVSGLNYPGGIVVSGGNLFVTSYYNGTIGEYNATTGAMVNAALVSGLNHPVDIAVSGGNLFVTNNVNNQLGSGTIGEYTTSGATVNPALVTGLNYQSGIAVSGGNLYALGNLTLGVYTTSGATVNAALVSLNGGAHDVAMSGGNLFVTSYAGGGFISEYNATTGATVNANLLGDTTKWPAGIAVVSTPLPGDYNDNGVVDAADYTVWRDSLGSTGTGLAADGDGNGLVNTLDYDFWKSHFGTHAGSGAGDFGELSRVGAAGVPEPSTIALAALAVLLVVLRRNTTLHRVCTKCGMTAAMMLQGGPSADDEIALTDFAIDTAFVGVLV